jgi:hypothetical protein
LDLSSPNAIAPARTLTAFVFMVVATFNLLSLFLQAGGQGEYRQPASLRAQVFLCGAVLGQHGHAPVLFCR